MPIITLYSAKTPVVSANCRENADGVGEKRLKMPTALAFFVDKPENHII